MPRALLAVALLTVVQTRDVRGNEVAEDNAEIYVDLAALVKIADRYALPDPPREAHLVLAGTRWSELVGNSSTSLDPRVYVPAFLIERLPNGQARVMIGSHREVVAAQADHEPAVRPLSLQQQEKRLGGYVLRCNDYASFVTAVQLARRGDVKLAQQVYTAFRAAKFYDDGEGRYAADPPLLLAASIYRHYQRAAMHENAAWKDVHKKLSQLNEEFPKLFSDDEKQRELHRRTIFLRDLAMTATAPTAAPGTVEALLFEWGDRGDVTQHRTYFDDVAADDSARAILHMGARAIPELAKFKDDTRLTRTLWPRTMGSPGGPKRLGELAAQLLDEMAGSQSVEKALSIAAGADAERAFFEAAAVKLDGDSIVDFHEAPLWILSQMHPQSLVGLCTRIPAKASERVQFFDLAEAVSKSRLPQSHKSDALAGMCERLDDPTRKRPVLQQLARVDESRCAELLRPALAKLETDFDIPDRPYWQSTTASFTHVVMELQNDGIWKAYLRLAKRSVVGLRMEMMNPMNYGYIGDKNRQRRLAFLAAFLDDATLRDQAHDETNYSGPCAAFTFEKIEVRNFVAMHIASILEIDVRPTEFWSDEQWSALRTQVETRLGREKLPELAE